MTKTALLLPNRYDPLAYYDARFPLGYEVTAPATGTALSQWNDLSGNDRHLIQGTAARRPAYRAVHAPAGNRPAIQFDGTDDGMVLPGTQLPQSTAVTVYVVVQNTMGTQQAVVGRANANGTHVSPFWRWVYSINSNNQNGFRRDATTNNGPAMTSAVGLTRRVISYKTQTEQGYSNGVLEGDAADGSITYPNGATDLMVGMTTTGAENLNGSIERIAIYDGTHNDTDRAAIEAYMLTPDDTFSLSVLDDPYSRAIMRDNPVGWLRFSGGAARDLASEPIATAISGTALVNGATITSPSIIPNVTGAQALTLDGVNDHMVVPAATRWEPQYSQTIEAWVVPDTVVGTRTIAVRSGDWSIKTINGLAQFILTTSAGVFTINATSGALVPGNLYHIAAVYRDSSLWGSDIRIYVNGNEVGTKTTVTGTLTVDSKAIYLGANVGTSEFWQGKIADFAVYSYALSSRRVLEHYRRGLGTYAVNLRPQWETFGFEYVELLPPPEWEPMRTNQSSPSPFPLYRTSWDGHTQLDVSGQYGAAMMLFKNEGYIPADTDWDITDWCLPDASATGKILYSITALCHDGVYQPGTPYIARNGYQLWLITDGTTANAQMRKYVNFVETGVTGTVTYPLSLWNAAHKIRAQRRGNILRFKIWDATNPEPIAWDASAIDNSPSGPGWAGIGFVNDVDGTARRCQFDDIKIYGGAGMRHFRVRGGVEVPLDLAVVRGGIEIPATTEVP